MSTASRGLKHGNEHQLGNGMAINATAYIGECHVCTRIDKFQNGLARFTKRSANSDSAGEKVKCFKPWPISRNVRNLSITLTTVNVPYRVTFQTVHTKSHVGAKYSHGCRCEPGICFFF